MTARTYYDADSTEGQPIFSPSGIGPSRASKRVNRVIAYAFKSMGLPFEDRSHLPVRRHIARMRLTPPQLAMLVRHLGSHDAGRYPIPEDADRCERYGCSYGEYRAVVFYAYRAALSLLVETAPRSRVDLHDLMETLMAWPGALPPEPWGSVSSVIGAHVADTIAGRPFERRALVPAEVPDEEPARPDPGVLSAAGHRRGHEPSLSAGRPNAGQSRRTAPHRRRRAFVPRLGQRWSAGWSGRPPQRGVSGASTPSDLNP